MRFAKIMLAAMAVLLPMQGAEVPRKSPEFAVLLPGGKQVLLSQYRGKVVALEFLFTTCPHCQVASRVMTKLFAEYGPKGFQPLGVAFNDNSDKLVGEFVKDFGATYPVGFSPRESVLSYLGYGPDERLSVPQMVIIDRKGEIRQQSLPANDGNTASEANMRQMIEKLLAEPAGKASAVKKPAPAKKKAS
jgi:peroxiredoxin